MQPETAMIFAAGFGTRMGALTKTMPKPLVPVLGKPMIDHALGHLTDAGIQSVFVNTHYFADQLGNHLSTHPLVTTIHEEPRVLETGGGLKNALPLIGNKPVFTLNCDALWSGENPATQLARLWMPDEMDGLLLVLKYANTSGYTGQGDFFLTDDGKLQRKGKPAPYVYSGIQIIKTDLLKDISKDCFSINLLWEKMIACDRLYGAVYEGDWVDVGHPAGIEAAEEKTANV
ncbi:MAG: nucleotidyltransferase family protein [Amylibacter sp.]